MLFTKQQMLDFADFCGRDYNKTSDGWCCAQHPQGRPASTEELLEDFLSETPPTVQAKELFRQVHRKLSELKKPDGSRTEW
jgi:hypothetical protein